MRINKFLAGTGITSRRGADILISQNKVQVNGKDVTSFGQDIDIDSDVVTVCGEVVNYAKQFYYLAMHKPKGCVCTLRDDAGRKTVMDYVPESFRNIVKPVGRLDYATEGLLILTNDGKFANIVAHPSSSINKHYLAKIEGVLTRDEISNLRNGVKLDDGDIVVPRDVKITNIDTTRKLSNGESMPISSVELIIEEGKNRVIRRMFEALNKNVIFLKRTQIGPLKLGGLPRGTCKEFDPEIFLYKTNTLNKYEK